MAIVNSTMDALSSRDRFNLVRQFNLGWEIQDNREHRSVSIHFDEAAARAAYAAILKAEGDGEAGGVS